MCKRGKVAFLELLYMGKPLTRPRKLGPLPSSLSFLLSPLHELSPLALTPETGILNFVTILSGRTLRTPSDSLRRGNEDSTEVQKGFLSGP